MYAHLILSSEECVILLKEIYDKKNSQDNKVMPFHLPPSSVRNKALLFFEIQNENNSLVITESMFISIVTDYFDSIGLNISNFEMHMDDDTYSFAGITLEIQKNHEFNFEDSQEWIKSKIEKLEFENYILVK